MWTLNEGARGGGSPLDVASGMMPLAIGVAGDEQNRCSMLYDSGSIHERKRSGNRNGVVRPRQTWREMRAASPRACVFIARLVDASGGGSL